MAGGARLCMKISGECTMESHVFLKVFTEAIPGVNDGVWLVIAKPSPHLPEYAFFQPNL